MPSSRHSEDAPTLIMAPVPPSFGSTFSTDGPAPSEYLEVVTAETGHIPKITAPVKEDAPERSARPAEHVPPATDPPAKLGQWELAEPQPAAAQIPTQQTPTGKTSGVVRTGSLIAIASIASRLTGFLAKIVIGGVLLIGVVNDSYTLANTLPNIVFELLIGGVLTSVAIPLLTRAQRGDADGGQEYTQRLVTLALVGLLSATVLAVAAAPLLTKLYLSPASKADAVLTTHLAYLLLPQIFFYGMAALFGAILNTKERFLAPAWAPVANNVLVILVATLLFFVDGPTEGLGLSTTQFLLLGVGTTAGIVLQAVIMLPSLRKSGFRFKWRIGWDKRMGEASGLAGWAVAYVLVSQVGYIIATNIASTAEGGITTFAYASLLFQMPYGILGVSILTAIMPRMSRHAAAGEMDSVKADVSLANRLSAVALLPVSAAIIAIGGAIGVLAFAWNPDNAEAALRIGATCAGLAVGLLPLAMSLVQMRVFYAMKDGRTPVIINAIMVAVRIPLLYLATTVNEDLLLPGLALATAISYIVGAVVGEIWLRARFGVMGSRRVLVTITKMTVASAVGGAAAWLIVRQVWRGSPTGVVEALGQVVIGGIVGLLVIGVAALALRVEELDPVTRKLRALLGLRARNSESSQILAVPGSVTPAVNFQHVVPRKQVSATVNGDGITPGVPPASEASTVVAVDGLSGSDNFVMLTPGAMVGGRYRLVNLIAVDGSSNRFWRAKDTVLPRDMAITLLPEGPNTAATVARTLRAGRLHHIGLPQTLDLGTEYGQSYVVGQWVDGATLTDLLAGGPLEDEVASSITAKVADAVAEAHRNGISLGAVHPSLVRVNFDGQVRLSHVIAQSGATPDQDIRAIGALLYLMLTGTWPLPQAGMSPALAGMSPALPPAPTSGGREVPASEVRAEAAPSLTALAERTLHPEGPSGVRSPGAIAALLQVSTATALGVEAVNQPVRLATPVSASILAERRLRNERRVKLAVAGVMLTALTALLCIVIGSVVKQIVNDVQDPVALVTTQPTVLPSTEEPTSAAAAPAPVPTETAAPTATSGPAPAPAAPTPVAVPIVSGQVYDPQGDGNKDYTSKVDRVWDGDPATYWQTFTYKQAFPSAFKTGVGLMLELQAPASPTQIVVSTITPGIKIEIIASDGNVNAPLDPTKVLASSDVGDAPAAINLVNAPTSKFIIVFVTGLVKEQGGNQFEGTLSEITVQALPAA
ncbi:murein biosynthesis integral membrane protein MurJ [Nakamurella antarctica]|uniref:murein biosynthesis integral membrane protein MurJ n=1 Tax=Nakamurella antarctica TaxID=1902245 RepID=UPI0013DE74D5|nr:murein biosynthesis integral membrane protein MurJ [Nakamurella antarctica]